MKIHSHHLLPFLIATSAFAQAAPDAGLAAAVTELQSGWDRAQYQITDKDAKTKAFEALEAKADAAITTYPQSAELKIWDGIIYSSQAGVEGGMGALPMVKKAKSLFEAALAINPNAMNGGAHTSLGSLYYKVPGWPIAFGDNSEAKKHLQAALKISPNDIDANYFYGDYLVQQKEYAEALTVLEKAMQAPARAGREIADQGRRKEIEADMTLAQNEIHADSASRN